MNCSFGVYRRGHLFNYLTITQGLAPPAMMRFHRS